MRKKTYIGKPCKHGHEGIRYRSCGSCVDCVKASAERSRKAWEDKRAAEFATLELEGSPIRDVTTRSEDKVNRLAARGLGKNKYEGRPCGKCGSKTRYVNRGSCVNCISATNALAYVEEERVLLEMGALPPEAAAKLEARLSAIVAKAVDREMCGAEGKKPMSWGERLAQEMGQEKRATPRRAAQSEFDDLLG